MHYNMTLNIAKYAKKGNLKVKIDKKIQQNQHIPNIKIS